MVFISFQYEKTTETSIFWGIIFQIVLIVQKVSYLTISM